MVAEPLAAVEAGTSDPGEDGTAAGWDRPKLAQFEKSEPPILRRKTGGKLSLAACEDVVAQAVANVTARLQDGLLGDKVNLSAYLRHQGSCQGSIGMLKPSNETRTWHKPPGHQASRDA
ncbi:hypothetical protein ABTX82_33105 [Streptomyces lavendulae]|uniref:hypothetical protein n=1 Tax=Streptomyces lavendulae TaxID=1914 RepID=UPI00332FB261